MAAVIAAAAQGVITPDEALALAQTVESCTRTLEAAHITRRRHWHGVMFREWVKRRGGKIPLPWRLPPKAEIADAPHDRADTIGPGRYGRKQR